VRFPTLDETIACNEAVRGPDEVSPSVEDDELDRVARALERAATQTDPIDAAAALAFEIAAAQGFYEGNKRTAALLARWVLAVNSDLEVDQLIRPDDPVLGDLLIRAARGESVEAEICALLRARADESAGEPPG
jgi:prophage maintenance system killer protein